MSTELVGQPITVVSPRTGEVIDLDASDEALAGFIADVREQESLLREARSLVGRELLARMDKRRKWTTHVPGYKLSAPSLVAAEEWNGAELRETLLAFVDADELSIEAVDAAVETFVDFKVKKVGINALRKGGGAVAAAVDALARPVEKERRVSVSRG